MDIQNILELIALTLGIATGFIALIRALLLSPLDKKLDDHASRIVADIEHGLMARIEKRIDKIEASAKGRSHQGVLWGKALYEDLKRQNIEAPDPEMYKWSDQ